MKEIKKLNTEIVCFAKSETYYLVMSQRGRVGKIKEKMCPVSSRTAEEFSKQFGLTIQIR